MTVGAMQIPKSGASRLSKETWIEAEILKRYQKAPTVRKVIETAISEAVTELLGSGDPEFIKIMQQVRAEGIDDD
jgi:uncharacterized protein YqeY